LRRKYFIAHAKKSATRSCLYDKPLI